MMKIGVFVFIINYLKIIFFKEKVNKIYNDKICYELVYNKFIIMELIYIFNC